MIQKEESNDNPKTPILRHGALHCPYCSSPLTIDEPRLGEYFCIYCKNQVGRLSDDVMIELARSYPQSTLQERLLEMRII
ncbi:MAG: TFIIB-type zinc ribbon-containing protein [Nitrososphaerales archaeon]